MSKGLEAKRKKRERAQFGICYPMDGGSTIHGVAKESETTL